MKLMQELQLATNQLGNYLITLGDGPVMKGSGICHNVPGGMQGHTVTKDFLALSLTSFDAILGMKWLSSLRWVQAHFRGM